MVTSRLLVITTLVIASLAVVTSRANADETSPAPATGKEETAEWSNIIEWTHAWDVSDAVLYDDSGEDWSIPAEQRIATIPDSGSENVPLKRDTGVWGGLLKLKPVPGPQYIASSPLFRGRPAIFTDAVGEGGLGRIYSALASATDPRDPALWFHAPDGHEPPYWGAVLCRPAESTVDKFGAWDAYNGHLGTTMTMARGLHPQKRLWGTTTSLGRGDPWPSTNVEASSDQTVLVVGCVDGDKSFMEINWRDSEGTLRTERATFRLANYSAKEIFLGFVHSSYLSAAGLKTGAPRAEDLDRVRGWSAQWIPPSGPLSAGP